MLDVLCVSFRNDLARLVIVVFGIVLVLALVRMGEPAPPSPYSAVDPDPVADGIEVLLKVFESSYIIYNQIIVFVGHPVITRMCV